MFISDMEIDNFISEDVPYFDLTTKVLGISGQYGKISFFTRENITLCGTEEAERIFSRFNIKTVSSLPSGSTVQTGDVFLIGEGNSENLHCAWKVCQNLIDRCSGIATKTAVINSIVKSVNPDAEVLSTRKIFPGVKKLLIKSVLCGGGLPHRLGLSETVLVFKQHMNFMGGIDGFIEKIPEIKTKISEKKLIVESENIDDAIKLVKGGAEGIQFDKLCADDIKQAIKQIKMINPNTVILAAGGIDEHNASDYAASGVNAVVVTCLYNAKPADISVKIERC